MTKRKKEKTQTLKKIKNEKQKIILPSHDAAGSQPCREGQGRGKEENFQEKEAGKPLRFSAGHAKIEESFTRKPTFLFLLPALGDFS